MCNDSGCISTVSFKLVLCAFQIQIYIFLTFCIRFYGMFLVHGNWGEWSEYGDCTVTCGAGQKRRFRTCTNPAPRHNGRTCPGNNQDTQSCNTQPCAGMEGHIYFFLCSLISSKSVHQSSIFLL